jgi:hypothetical protein
VTARSRATAKPADPQPAADRRDVPGASGFELDAPITVLGIKWTPEDGAADASPIGAALAAEVATRDQEQGDNSGPAVA